MSELDTPSNQLPPEIEYFGEGEQSPESPQTHYEPEAAAEEDHIIVQTTAERKRPQYLLMLAPAVIFLVVIFGVGALAFKYLNPSAPTAIVSASPSPAPSPTPETEQEDWTVPVGDNLANATDGAIFASPKGTPSPQTSGSPQPTVSPTPAGPMANLYFHTVTCTSAGPSDGLGNQTVSLDGRTFTKDNAPTQFQCNMIFQNSEAVETGEITFDVVYDGKTLKRENVGTLKKGNHPNGEFKDYSVWNNEPSKEPGEHTVQVRINPDKTFPETNWNDNTYTAKYTITQ